MLRPERTRPARAKTLVQQQTDFTAEGAPPPGKVAAQEPVMPATPAPRAALRARNALSARRRSATTLR
jgi:hypothetical protein